MTACIPLALLVVIAALVIEEVIDRAAYRVAMKEFVHGR